ncbi:MAG TPA: glycosyltransferase [Candidatus Paceibacterota bacterium]|nr:glycosyltransferase [Candidatus Paceibacterota bacterium]
MKILVIGTIDSRGGAAQVSWELRKRLKADGHQVSTFVRYKYSDEPDVFAIPRRRWQDWLVRLFANDLRFARTSYLFDTPEYREADIIHCHNLHSNFFNLRDLIRMSREKPVAWTLHDMWALTGFAYNSATLRRPNKKRFLLYLWDTTPFLLRAKARIYARSKLYIVTVSDWLKKETGNGILRGQDIRTIHNGIDTATFAPGNKEAARRALGLPLDKKIVAFGIKGWMDSQNVVESYKGRDDVFFVAIGHDLVRTTNENFKALPRTEDRAELAQYLCAADVFLHPTPEDSFGLISAEAMACGVPIVAYGIDALPEVVAHKKTGYVARYEDVRDAIAGIDYVLGLSPADYQAMSMAARARIVETFSEERMYRQYLDLYRSLIESRR